MLQTFDKTRRKIILTSYIAAVPITLYCVNYPLKAALFFAPILALLIMFFWPELWLIIVFLAICDFFSMINGDTFKIAGIFSLHDLFFLSAFLPLLGGIYEKRHCLGYVFHNRIAKAIYLLMALCFVQIIVTVIRYGEPLTYIIRTCRIYFYYLLFFPFLFILLNPKHLRRFVKWLIFLCIILCILFITQFIIGANHVIFPGGKIVWQNPQGFEITRIYIKDGLIPALLFHISLAIFFIVKRYRHKFLNMMILLFTGIQSILLFGRAHIVGIISGVLLGVISLNGLFKRNILLKIMGVGIVVIFIFCTASLFNPDIPDAVISRAISTYDEVIHWSGTFGYRLTDSRDRIETVKDNWLFGIGFIHDESKLTYRKWFINLLLEKGIRTGDSGLISLMLDFGIIGVIYFCFLTFLVFNISKDIYNHHPDRLSQAIALGIWCFFLGRFLSSITLCPFSVYYHNVIGIVISLVFLAVLDYGLVVDTVKTFPLGSGYK